VLVLNTNNLYFRAFDAELLYICQTLNIPINEVAVTWTEIEGMLIFLRYLMSFNFFQACLLWYGILNYMDLCAFIRIESHACMELVTNGFGLGSNLGKIYHRIMENNY